MICCFLGILQKSSPILEAIAMKSHDSMDIKNTLTIGMHGHILLQSVHLGIW